MKPPTCDPGDFGMAQHAESTLFMPERAKSAGTPKRVQHVSPFPFFEVGLPSSRPPLLGAGPLRTGRETFVLIRLRPFERLFQGDAVSVRKDVGDEPCRGTLDGAGHGSLHS
jgi:hypothetical protein